MSTSSFVQKLFLFLFISIVAWLQCSRAEEDVVPVIPRPQVVERLPKTHTFEPQRTHIILSLQNTHQVSPAIDEICSTSVALFGSAPSLIKPLKKTIWVGCPSKDVAFDQKCRAERLVLDKGFDPEGYCLLVKPQEIIVLAKEERGAFYGLQTLLQLVRASSTKKGEIVCVRIRDWPAMRVRAVMDDISRGPVPTDEYFRRQLRRLAEMKVNTVSYYIEHVVATYSHPEFAPPGAALNIAQWKDLTDYARKYQIDLIGNFQSFGHFEKILSTPTYAHLGEAGSLLSPAYEESYSFLQDIYREMVPAFSGSFFQTHCDETFDLGKGASKPLVDSLGKGTVYLGHVLRLRDMLQRLGVRMMMWGDVLLQYPDIIDRLPRDVIIGTWTYDTLSSYKSFIEPFTARGFDVLVTPGVLNSGNVIPNFRQSFANIDGFIRDGVACKALGAFTTVWDDGGTALFSRDWYGVAYAADRMWNADITDRTFDSRFDLSLYAERSRSLSRSIHLLLKLADLSPTDGMSERNLWSPVVPDSGRPLRLNVSEWDQVVAIVHEADSLLGSGRPRASQPDWESMRFTAQLYESAGQLRLAMRDAARAYSTAAEDTLLPEQVRRQYLLEALNLVTRNLDAQSHLKSWFARLWLSENRLYSLENVEKLYDSIINGLRDVKARLRVALTRFEQGEFLPGPSALRLAILESSGWYFRDWLIAGPIDSMNQDVDYLAVMGGEAKAAPAVTQEFTYGNARYRWRRLSARSAAEVDFAREFPPGKGTTIYAQSTVESPDVRQVRALVGCGGPMRIFVNGNLAYDQRKECPLSIDQSEVTLPLLKGKNQLLIKLAEGGQGDWGFSFRLPDSTVRNRKNRYKIIR